MDGEYYARKRNGKFGNHHCVPSISRFGKESGRKYRGKTTMAHTSRTRGDSSQTTTTNESLLPTNSHIGALAEACTLTDVHAFMHQSNPKPPPATFIKGQHKIDHILCSAEALKSLNRCGIDSYGCHFKSDHHGMFVDFNLTQILGGTPEELGSLYNEVGHIRWHFSRATY